MRDITFARYRLIGIARLPIVSEKADFTGLPSPLSLSLCTRIIPAIYVRRETVETRKMQLPSW